MLPAPQGYATLNRRMPFANTQKNLLKTASVLWSTSKGWYAKKHAWKERYNYQSLNDYNKQCSTLDMTQNLLNIQEHWKYTTALEDDFIVQIWQLTCIAI